MCSSVFYNRCPSSRGDQREPRAIGGRRVNPGMEEWDEGTSQQYLCWVVD